MKSIKLIISVFVLLPVCALIFLNILFCGTDTIYVSSDGKWSERQMIYRNPKFKDIISSFEEYKVKCNAADAELERLRSKPEWIMLESWLNDSTNKKENIPLSTKNLDVTFGFSTRTIEPAACYKNA